MDIKKYSRSPIAKRLLFITVGVSTLIALIITAIQLGYDYYQDIRRIESTLQQIEITSIPSITIALWDLDDEQVKVQIQSIMKISEIVSAKMSFPKKQPIEYNKEQKYYSDYIKAYSFNLTYHDKKDNIYTNLGKLTIYYDYKNIYLKLIEKLALTFTLNCVKTLTVSFIILFVFWKLVTKHLVHISDKLNYVEKSIKNDSRLLVNELENAGELNTLIQSINRFYKHFTDIKNSTQTNEDSNHSFYEDFQFLMSINSKELSPTITAIINKVLFKTLSDSKSSASQPNTSSNKDNKQEPTTDPQLIENTETSKEVINSNLQLSKKLTEAFNFEVNINPKFYYKNDIIMMFSNLPIPIETQQVSVEDDIMFSADTEFLERSIWLVARLIREVHNPTSVDVDILNKNLIIHIKFYYTCSCKDVAHSLPFQFETAIYIINLYIQHGLQGEICYRNTNNPESIEWEISFPSIMQTMH